MKSPALTTAILAAIVAVIAFAAAIDNRAVSIPLVVAAVAGVLIVAVMQGRSRRQSRSEDDPRP
jgi:hypothetical protein